MKQKKWFVREFPDSTSVEELRSALKIDKITAGLLLQRGIHNYQEAETFFNPSLNNLHDPFLMKHMNRAVELLSNAIKEQKKVLLYGDYDVDGTTAVALMYHVLEKLLPNLSFYIPDRYSEGYGLSNQGVDFAIQEKVDVMILLDCGIKAVEKIQRAEDSGVRVIVCDHHTPGKELPNCCVLDPKQTDCEYPYKELSGCGVGFKLLQGLFQRMNLEPEILYDQLDLLAVSIAADIVDVTGENRILAAEGLKRLNAKPRLAFTKMASAANRSFPLSLSDVVFTIAPRINAAGRLRNGRFAVELLVHPESEEIEQLVNAIEADNSERKVLDAQITGEALELITDEATDERRTTVVFREDWHKGVVGIVASRLIEKHYRPTIVLTGSGEIISGSVRSIPGINVYDALSKCEEHLIQFGGHAFAAGLTLLRSQLNQFKDAFEQAVSDLSQGVSFREEVSIDAKLDFRDIFGASENRLELPKFKRIIDRMEPFGPGNMKPVFVSSDLFSIESRILKDLHLKLRVTQKNADLVMDAIGFSLAERMDDVASGIPFDMAYTLENNTWNNRTTLQMMIKDVRAN
jgi:single-stranded-DNA-specific exonuclease